MIPIINLKTQKVTTKHFIQLNQHLSDKSNSPKLKLISIYRSNNKELMSILCVALC